VRRPLGCGRSAWRRPDLEAAFPEPLGADAGAMVTWAWTTGVDEGLAPAFLPAPTARLPLRRRLDLAARTARTAAARSRATVRSRRRHQGRA